MQHPAGRWLPGVAGVIMVIIGLVLLLQGIRHTFMKNLRTSQMSARTRRVVRWLGTIGTSARGVVFALAGVLVIEARTTAAELLLERVLLEYSLGYECSADTAWPA
jgi:uncharacterized membrane protein